ncbi:MAG TPA: hypothetical protein VF882_08590 [Gemmatimonadales bacterium]
MTGRARGLAGLAAALAAAGWAGGGAGAGRSEGLGQGVKTIATSSVALPQDYRDLTAVRARFDSLIAERLRAAGFSVVPPQIAESIWLRVRDSVGGYYDTYTGKRVEAKYEVVRTATLTELKTRYQADAWLHPVIRVVGARFSGGKVKWHGVEEQSGAPGGLGGFLFGSKIGAVPALSLFVFVEDMAGKDLYAGVGGLRLVERIQGDRFVPIPRDSLFNDGARNAAAIHLALDSLPLHLGGKQGP